MVDVVPICGTYAAHTPAACIRSDRMSRNTSLTLGHHFADFVDQQVGRGRYGSASEVVRAGLRLLEAQEAQLAALREALIEGETSGAARPLDVDAFLKARRPARTR